MTCIFSILFLRLWVIFTIITPNSFSGSWPISSFLFGVVGFYLVHSLAQYFSVLSCYLTYCVWRILSCFWSWPSVSEAGPVVCVGFMLGGTCACLLVGGGEFSPPSNEQGCVSGVFWGVSGKPVSSWGLASCLGKVLFAGCCQQLSGARSWH